MSRHIRTLAIALALTLLLPSAAFAGVREYQIQFAPTGDPTSALAIVNALLDPQDALPAEIQIPVPAGATVLWAGEVLGGDPADDPTSTYTVERVDDMDVYTMTLTQSYTGQMEIALDPASVKGDRVESGFTWVNTGPEVMVNAAVVAETGAADIQVVPARVGDVQSNDIGETLHPLEGRRVATGDSYAITASWERTVANASGATDSPGALPYLLGALLVAILALIAVVVGERTRRNRRLAE